MNRLMILVALFVLVAGMIVGAGGVKTTPARAQELTTPIVDTAQHNCYNDTAAMDCPSAGSEFFGQDAQYAGNQPAYQDNGDGTVTDLNTGLMWQQTPDYTKVSWNQAFANAETLNLGGYNDWRVPTIKELYSLIDFNGSGPLEVPYIDTGVFGFEYGDEGASDVRYWSIDARYWSGTKYVGTVMGGVEAVFGFNFADGRIKGYPIGDASGRDREMMMFVRYVRGNPDYGINNFMDNGDGTITDVATGLMWMQNDSVDTYDWSEALAYCENLNYGGYDDWRLPDAKELQSIVDYSRSPTTTNSAAIDPIFNVTEIESWYWTSTTLQEGRPETLVEQAVYIMFGQGFGMPNGQLTDVHGAGAQRSDPKSGDPADYASGVGTTGQDDQVRIYNYVRCVRQGASLTTDTAPASQAASNSSTGQGAGGGQGQQPPGGQGGQGQQPGGQGGQGQQPPPAGGQGGQGQQPPPPDGQGGGQ